MAITLFNGETMTHEHHIREDAFEPNSPPVHPRNIMKIGNCSVHSNTVKKWEHCKEVGTLYTPG